MVNTRLAIQALFRRCGLHPPEKSTPFAAIVGSNLFLPIPLVQMARYTAQRG